MNESAASHTLSTPAGNVSLRPEKPGDDPFLFTVYAVNRQDEMALTNWDAPTRHAFLTMQFKAMRQAYSSMFPHAEFSIIELEGRPIGRQVVDEDQRRLCVVDVALLPDFQNRGIGTALMRAVLQRAQRAGKTVLLHVLTGNRAIRFYERLAFRPVGQAAMHQEMEWIPPGL